MAKPKHRKASMTSTNIKRAATVTTGGMAVIAISAASSPAMAAPDSAWAGVIECESGGNPTAQNPHSTASGLYQIIDETWAAYGGLAFAPHAKGATPEQQRIVAEAVLAGQGPGAWVCNDSLLDWVNQALPAPVATPEPAPAPAPVASNALTGDKVVETARTFIGADYVWGGESYAEGGFDCSGLVLRVYADLGINLPRTAAAQAQVGTVIPSLDQAQPGDLLAWPGHIAIYSGNGQMVESSTPGTKVHERAVWGSPTIHRVLTGTEAAPAAPIETQAAETPAPPAPAPVQVEPANQITVQPGNTLSGIGAAVGEDWHSIYEANKQVIGDNPDLIFPKQVLMVGGLPLANAPVKVEEEPVVEEKAGTEVAETVPVAAPEGVAVITNSAGPVSSKAQSAADAVFNNVRGASLISIGGTRASAVDMAGHPSGNALDYMVLGDTALGDAIVSYTVANWDTLGVEYIIYEQRILTTPGGSWKTMEDRGSATANHMDHVHVNYR